MILQVMQHRFLSESTDEAAVKLRECIAAVERQDTDILKLLEEQQVEPAELREALGRAQEAAAALAMPVEQEATLFPRDAVSSHMQSILQRYFITRGLTQKIVAQGAVAVPHPISDVSLVPAAAAKAPDQLFGAMSQTDVGWLACIAAMGYRMFGKRRAFPNQPAPPKRIASDARVFLVGDWGSGISRAGKIADRIQTMLESEGTREQHVIHLGDVYYSGWPGEYDDHFLPSWPVRPGQEGRYGSWSLNSNHDMYSGGHGYFDHLLKDARFKDQQGSSFFSLENDNWQMLGLDSAWEGEDLAGDQFEWVERRQAENPQKKLMLMTHHQPFSAFEGDCVELQRLLARNRVTAWFWGHEHRFAMYKPRPDLPYGRLIGHGGVPVWARSKSKVVPDTVDYVSTRGFRSGVERFALFGFTVLDFEGPRIRVQYIDEYGEVEKSETIE
jgi:hypothetical protein